MKRRIKYRLNVVLQYSLLTLIMIVAIIFALTNVIVNFTTERIIDSHIELYPSVLSVIVANDELMFEMFKNEVVMNDQLMADRILPNFAEFDEIIRIKVWSKQAKVLWSDKKEIIGLSFESNDKLLEAIQGNITYGVDKPEADENLSETEYKEFLEIYTPIHVDNEVIGVIEVYVDYAVIETHTSKIESKINSLVIIAGSVLYALQFSIFYSAYYRQKKANYQLRKTKEVTIFALATLAETRDQVTGDHLERTSAYVKILAEGLSKVPGYSKHLTKQYIEELVLSSKLHDIGKVGIPDQILLKPGKLTIEELEEMKTHSLIGTSILESADEKIEFKSFLSIAKQITLHHHEWWDGTGYPDGLSGEDIPISARIMAVADVYDAVTSVRPYKEAISHDEAVKLIIDEKRTHFDPEIIDVFLKYHEEIRNVKSNLARGNVK